MDSLYSHLILLQIVFVSFHYLLPENEQPPLNSRLMELRHSQPKEKVNQVPDSRDNSISMNNHYHKKQRDRFNIFVYVYEIQVRKEN